MARIIFLSLVVTVVTTGQDSNSRGGGVCKADEDCQLAGVCNSTNLCACDPGWTGAHCELLDLAPISSNTPNAGAVWNTETSPTSSWGMGGPVLFKGLYHAWFAQLPDKCGLSSWLPGSTLVHGVSKTRDGAFTRATDNPQPAGQRNPLSTFSTNPHVLNIAESSTWLLYFNGRAWPTDDVTYCEPNTTGRSPWHGGGVRLADVDCPGALAHTPNAQPMGKCVDGHCVCEHHSFGLNCDEIVETINVAYAVSPYGPWTQLLDDGAPFFGDGNKSLGMSNPSAFAIPGGTAITLAYSRAPDVGVSLALTWKGPYQRLFVSENSPSGLKANFSVAGCGEDPFIYMDYRGTYRIICHGRNDATSGLETGGQSFSKDMVNWTPGPGPVYTSLMSYTNGTTRKFARRERPTLLLDRQGFPLVLYTGVQGPNASYSCHSDLDRGCHSWTLAQSTRHGQLIN